ncbi:zinc metalloprotease HtpX [Plantactinospora mayteni]|uniref:Peptidase M48 n=1 Tax=Plantactinospora mayteni TaxID=566021 RepID=A0ABQ4F092_9ACTN|nr:M48 family metalloprotease [Plantactinospora mayteni]GIH00328.1 peptidase M48 [Plantactinospora mayteni]
MPPASVPGSDDTVAPDGAPGPDGSAPQTPTRWVDRLFAHRPPGYPSIVGWLRVAALRDWRAALGAFAGAWLNVPLAVLFTGLFLLFYLVQAIGLLFLGGPGTAGLFRSAEDLISQLSGGDILPEQVGLGGAISILVSGGIVVAIVTFPLQIAAVFLAGLAMPWLSNPVDAPLMLIGQCVAGVTLAVVYTLYRVSCEPWLLRIGGARRLSRREAALLLPIARQVGAALGLSSIPMILIDPDRTPRAMAHTRHIVLSQGLLDEFNYDREAVAALFAHELVHWRNGDPVSRVFVRGLALPLYLLFSAANYLLRVFPHPLVKLLVMLIAWPVTLTVRFLVVPSQSFDARASEYRADAGAALAGHRAGMRRVLTRLRRSFETGGGGWDDAVCASHPPYELRLERLEARGETYPLPDRDAPAAPLPVAMVGSLRED